MKRFTLIILSSMLVLAFSFGTAFGWDSCDFSFKIKPYQANTRTDYSNFRHTYTYTTPWRVAMTDSKEISSSSKTYTTFWMEDKNLKNVTPARDVLEDAGWYETKSSKGSARVNVWLAAENNNYSNTVFACSGKWDEEP